MLQEALGRAVDTGMHSTSAPCGHARMAGISKTRCPLIIGVGQLLPFSLRSRLVRFLQYHIPLLPLDGLERRG